MSSAVKSGLRGDVAAAIPAAIAGTAAVAVADFALTTFAAPTGVAMGTAIRLAALEITLWLLVLPLIIIACIGAALSVRLVLRLARPSSTYAGLFAPSPPRSEPSRSATWLWAVALTVLAFAGLSTIATLKVSRMFKEPQLTALLLALVQLGLFTVLGALTVALARAFGWLGDKLENHLGRANPFSRPAVAAGVLVFFAIVAVRLAVRFLPQLGPLVPWRHMISLFVFVAATFAYRDFRGRGHTVLPAAKRPRRMTLGAVSLVALILVPLTLFRCGADPDTKALAESSSPGLARIIELVRKANDFDGDGFGSLLGETDCGPFDAKINPIARDIPDNGIDENCDGTDFQLGKIPAYRSGVRMPVPDAYQRDYNFLLITVDTVRYDHTTMGGYDKASGRNTTPNMDKLAKRSVNFTFANAPSAGTMASIPAILTSRYFHSGVALDIKNKKRGKPPKLLPRNVLISELFKKKGYATGAILSHYYFNDWGMEQGFDTYDNSIGKKNDPYMVTSDRLTDRAIEWIGKRSRKNWFLWIHYIDPHGRYVSHPGETSYGTTEMDLYDGELAFTDKHLGRLLDWLARSPSGPKTVIFLTSDHGDAFGEHGYINHGQDLHREILHIPLIAYVPNIQPRDVPGAVSPIDIFPTVADMLGTDITHLDVVGESLVPQLFYGRDAEKRVVFAETNYRNYVRAAVTSRYKLIRNLKSGTHRLFNLEKDPWEKKNVWKEEKEAFAEHSQYLDDWLEAVYYSRDTSMNEAMFKLADHLVDGLDEGARPVKGVSFDNGALNVIGVKSPKTVRPGQKTEFSVYFGVAERPSADYRLQVELWPIGDELASPKARSKQRMTAKGLFATSRWRPGEQIRDRFSVSIPRAWQRDEVRKLNIGIRVSPKQGKPIAGTGTAHPTDSTLIILGTADLAAKTSAPKPDASVP